MATEAEVLAGRAMWQDERSYPGYTFLMSRKLWQQAMLSQYEVGYGILDGPFRDRLLFPIRDVHGRLLSITGRQLNPFLGGPRYWHPSFPKGRHLYGLWQAKRSIWESGEAVVVEGPTSLLACVANGYANTVATLGVSFTVTHLCLLARYAQTVYMLQDQGAPGGGAGERMAQEYGFPLRHILVPMYDGVPKGFDPGDLHERGLLGDALQRAGVRGCQ